MGFVHRRPLAAAVVAVVDSRRQDWMALVLAETLVGGGGTLVACSLLITALERKQEPHLIVHGNQLHLIAHGNRVHLSLSVAHTPGVPLVAAPDTGGLANGYARD